MFEAPAISSDALTWDELPALRPDTSDAQYAWLSNVSADDPRERLEALAAAPEATAEVGLARALTALELNDASTVDQAVKDMLAADPWEWRAVWVSGLAAMQAKDHRAAQQAFNAVYGQVPGELAPKLALGLACELGSEPDLAIRLYQTCASTDANYVAPAAFGMARVHAARGDVQAAVAALDLVPATSRSFTEARRLRALHLYESADSLPVLSQAMSSIDGVRLDQVDRAELTGQILRAGPGASSRAKDPTPQVKIGSLSRRRRLAAGRARADLPHAGGRRTERDRAVRHGRQGQRRAKVDPDMTSPPTAPGAPRAGRCSCPQLRRRGVAE